MAHHPKPIAGAIRCAVHRSGGSAAPRPAPEPESAPQPDPVPMPEPKPRPNPKPNDDDDGEGSFRTLVLAWQHATRGGRKKFRAWLSKQS
jgi:hypothetical protein